MPEWRYIQVGVTLSVFEFDRLKLLVDRCHNDDSIIFCYAAVNRIDMQGNPVQAASRQHQGFSGFVFLVSVYMGCM